MKEQYTAPEMEIVEFENEDVITTSSNPVQCEDELPIM